MTITQDRLLKLVEASESIISLYYSHCHETLAEIMQVEQGTISLPDFARRCALRFQSPDILIAPQALVIQTERLKWRYTHKANARERERKKRRRHGIGPQTRRPGPGTQQPDIDDPWQIIKRLEEAIAASPAKQIPLGSAELQNRLDLAAQFLADKKANAPQTPIAEFDLGDDDDRDDLPDTLLPPADYAPASDPEKDTEE